MANMKPFWKSKTIGINLILGVLTYLLGDKIDLPPEQKLQLATGIFVGVNWFLRWITKDKITLN